jgi:hypothetical protein
MDWYFSNALIPDLGTLDFAAARFAVFLAVFFFVAMVIPLET